MKFWPLMIRRTGTRRRGWACSTGLLMRRTWSRPLPGFRIASSRVLTWKCFGVQLRLKKTVKLIFSLNLHWYRGEAAEFRMWYCCFACKSAWPIGCLERRPCFEASQRPFPRSGVNGPRHLKHRFN
ncbi:uncharacterized protein B0T23DRAFT_100326 [Neurospora hispaniola]|uniref:Uncharacterized protein n=1 Tax=Neurospora hispaniola TaxID=588809 RepID=A0AAJ0MUI4_9PEZI|nr:hypothetical protein B0T23DRAFT_100326 [Neurospora hispaniola]